jgi:hypothetical protein
MINSIATISMCCLVGLTVGFIALVVKLWPILVTALQLEFSYYYAKKDLEIQEKQVAIEDRKNRSMATTMLKLDATQSVFNPMTQTVHTSPQPLPQAMPLPEPEQNPIIRHAVWFPKAVNALHLIAIGESGSGKSTLARAIISESVKLGDVVIVDPHGRSNDWFGLKVIGAGRDYDGIDQFMRATLTTMSKRYKEYEAGCNEFKRLTVVIDETTSIAQKCDHWQQFFSDVSCEGRKVEMRLIVLVHGKGVKTLSLEGQGDLRHNLQFIYLGKHAVKQDKLAATMARPAVMEIDGINQLIDTSELTQMIPQNIVTRSEKPINENLPETQVNHDKTDLKELVSGLDNDYERIVANLLLSGMTDSAIAKHLGGAFDTNKKKVATVRGKLNGYLAGVQ